MNEHAAHTYKQQQVNTATPAKMVFMLFEKTLSRLQEAQHASGMTFRAVAMRTAVHRN